MKRLFPTFLIFAIILNGCCDDDPYCLVNRDQMKHYNIGDTFIYLNDLSTDTLIMSNFEELLIGEEDKGSTLFQTVHYIEYISYTFSVNSESQFNIGYNCNNNGEPSINLFGSSLSPLRNIAFIQINGKLYFDVILYTARNNNQGEITSLWFNKKFGIIKYKKSGNRIYYLQQ